MRGFPIHTLQEPKFKFLHIPLLSISVLHPVPVPQDLALVGNEHMAPPLYPTNDVIGSTIESVFALKTPVALIYANAMKFSVIFPVGDVICPVPESTSAVPLLTQVDAGTNAVP